MLESSYALCALTPPLRAWKLPHPDEIGFKVLATRKCYGHFRAGINGGKHEIGISYNVVGSLNVLISTMLHEMVHLEDFRRTGDGVSHGKSFRRLAAQVCRYHHLDPQAF